MKRERSAGTQGQAMWSKEPVLRFASLALGPGSRSARAQDALATLGRDTREEFAAPYSITSSGRASKVPGSSRPSA